MKRFAHARHAIAVLTYTTASLWYASAVVQCSAEADTLRTDEHFVRHALLSTIYLNDLGVADINDDGWLDIYTTNHQARPLILVNQRDGTFSNDVLRLQLGTATDYAGGEPSVNPAEPTLTIRSFRNYYYTPLFKINDTLSLHEIFIGSERTNPTGHSFALSQSDRHAMAWFDLDNDGLLDAVVADGGQGGRIRGRVEEGSGSYRVMLQRAGRFEEIFPYEQLSHYGCPTRQLSMADHDSDGDLDIYVVCGRGAQQAHQFFDQAADGSFSEVAAAKGLDAKDDGLSTWLDADGDGDLDLFWTTKREAWIYRNNDGQFDAELVGAIGDRARQISKSDYDGDGDIDLYLAAKNGSSLLVGEEGGFQIVEPESVGLPREALCGNWVDYNNDALQDLHVLPGGIFEQRADRQFHSTGLLKSTESLDSALCVWFDSNNDGSRDLLVAVPPKPTLFEKIRGRLARRIGEDRQVWISQNPALFFLEGITMGHPFFRPEIWDLTLYRAAPGDRHWLELELAGPAGNRPAIGGSVRLRTASGTQVQAVGHAEGSTRSSGHYRVYFGLDDKPHIDSVEVAWPDGSMQVMRQVPSDRLLTIQQESAN